MLKIRDDVDLKELENFGFKTDYYIDDKVYVKEIKKGLYKEDIIIWFKDREIQIRNNSQILLETLYDLIKANLVINK